MSDPYPYRRIADELRDEVLTRRLKPGERLPSEHTLAGRFGTTRATVRKALALLRSDGLIESAQGRGVFVREAPTVRMLGTGANYRRRRATGVTNFNAEVAASGSQAEQVLLEVGQTRAPADVAERLALHDDDPMVVVRRRRFDVDGWATQLVDGYYPLSLAAGTALARRRRIPGGVNAYLEGSEMGLQLARFVEELDVRMPTPAEAADLVMLPGVPLARVVRTAYTDEGQPVEVLVSLVPCDRHRFVYEIDIHSA